MVGLGCLLGGPGVCLLGHVFCTGVLIGRLLFGWGILFDINTCGMPGRSVRSCSSGQDIVWTCEANVELGSKLVKYIVENWSGGVAEICCEVGEVILCLWLLCELLGSRTVSNMIVNDGKYWKLCWHKMYVKWLGNLNDLVVPRQIDFDNEYLCFVFVI